MIVVTRPQPAADAWVVQAKAAGLDALALPMQVQQPAPDAASVRDAWQRIHSLDLLMAVSGRAVRAFAAARPDGAAPGWPSALRAAAVGPATRQALLEAGFGADRIVTPSDDGAGRVDGPQHDSEHLWPALQALRDWRETRVLVVRGATGRPWLAQQLLQAGARVEGLAVYRMDGPEALEGTARAAWQAAASTVRTAPHGLVWLWHSGQALAEAQRAFGGVACARAIWQHGSACAIHPRIAQQAQAAGFGRSLVCDGTVAGVVAVVKAAS